MVINQCAHSDDLCIGYTCLCMYTDYARTLRSVSTLAFSALVIKNIVCYVINPNMSDNLKLSM